jgi:hypothetical protein
MTAGFSAANAANKWLDVVRSGGASFTAITNAYVKLHTGDPGASAANNAAAGSTTRVNVTQASPSAGSMSINGTNPSWTNGGTSETITHISVWDASTAGNFLYSVALTASKAWASGDTLTLNSLTVAFTPIAA